MDGDDVDDLHLLQQLLEAESELAGVSKSTPTPKETNECQSKSSFENFLESLDSLPLKSNSVSKDCKSTDTLCKTGKDNLSSNKKNASSSAVHAGDTDSSDDEDNRKQERRFTEYGAAVKKMLDADEEVKQRSEVFRGASGASSWKSSAPSSVSSGNTLCLASKKKESPTDVYTDPLIGIRIINPLVSSAVIKERLTGRKVISMAQIKQFVGDGKPSDDWVVFGVIVSKLPPKTSSKGSIYCVIKLSDLKGAGNLKSISVFLFSRAYKNHGKDSLGTVVGILNPGILDNSRNHGDEACLSVDNPDRIMVVGTSKDFGTCKSKKKNGENCTSIVNIAQCEYCVYHVKQEYMKCSRRSDIQSSFNGTGLTNLRNKVLGKNEVFYAGQSFTAVPAKKSKKLHDKDQRRLSALSGNVPLVSSSLTQGTKKSNVAASLDLSHRQAQKDADRLRKLILAEKGSTVPNSPPAATDEVKLSDAKCAALTLIAKKKETITEQPKHCNKSLPDGPSTTPLSSVNDDHHRPSNAPLTSRGALATMSLKRKENKFTAMPSALGLGLGSNPLPKEIDVNESSSKVKSKNEKIRNVSENDGIDGHASKSKLRMQHKAKDFSPLDSKQLLKISSTGMNMESRLLKQAARITAEQEEASKLGINSTPSMLGLGRSSVKAAIPVLGRGHNATSTIDLDSPVNNKLFPSTLLNRKTPKSAKLKAVSLIQRSGGIQKEDPNFREFESRKKTVKKSSNESKGVKRPLSPTDHFICDLSKSSQGSQNEEQKAKMARFKELMEVTSKHTDLIEAAENEAQDDYFNKLEKKEQMEEKMLNTFKVACKAVRCLKCKYTAFSSSDLCKAEQHPLKVIDATKRFWKCGDCGNRTISLEVIPLKSCANCNSSRWERAAMIRERKVGISQETLSIRGLEEKFVGSVATGGNISLLVPDES